MSSAPLRILMIIPYDPYKQPFAVRTVRFAQELATRGHSVQLLYRPVPAGTPVRDHLPDNIDSAPMPSLSTLSGWRELDAMFEDADVVHFQKAHPQIAAAVFALSRRHRVHIHQDWDDDDRSFYREKLEDGLRGSDLTTGERARRLFAGAGGLATFGVIERLIPRWVDTIGGASMYLRHQSALLGCTPDAIYPAPVGVDCDVFHPDRRSDALRSDLGLTGPTVLYSGYFDVAADLRFFAEAIAVFSAKAPAAKCLVVGGGSGRDHLARLISRQRVPESIVMTDGFVPFAEMPTYIASSEIAALPFADTPRNRSKSSLTLLEAMACGVSVVTHDVGDIGWMLGEGGVVVDTSDPRDFGAALAALANDAERRRRLGKLARERVLERFTWSQSVDFLERAYRHRANSAGPIPDVST